MTFAEKVRELENANARLLAENADLRALLEPLAMRHGDTKWDGSAKEVVGDATWAPWNLRMYAKERLQNRDEVGLAAEIGCTVEELRRETAVGWLAPLQDEIARLTSELAKHQPEERVGECWCATWLHRDGSWRGMDGYPNASWCCHCGAHLGTDGIARRNADTARVQRVREALDGFEPREDFGAGFSHLRPASQLAYAIRAALDGPTETPTQGALDGGGDGE